MYVRQSCWNDQHEVRRRQSSWLLCCAVLGWAGLGLGCIQGCGSLQHTSPHMPCRPVRTEASGYNPHYNPRYNTSLCMHWQRGTCRQGNKCSFAHGALPLTLTLCWSQHNTALHQECCHSHLRAVLHWHVCMVRCGICVRKHALCQHQKMTTPTTWANLCRLGGAASPWTMTGHA